jgi:beta-galactosidase
MAEKYPEVLRVNQNGQRDEFGRRHNHCLTSPYYRKKVYEMNSILAKRYGKHPAVIGWHVSNEYNGKCYCPLCREAFTKWLEKKYEGDINKLNFQWWTTFWSHRFDDFSQVAPPLPHGDSYASLELDWRRFVSDQTQSFIANEIAGIREYSDLPTTINMMPYQPINYPKIAKEIDAVSWDSYPGWHSPKHLDIAPEIGFWHDFFRAMKQKPFLLMESTPSNVNWQEFNKLIESLFRTTFITN